MADETNIELTSDNTTNFPVPETIDTLAAKFSVYDKVKQQDSAVPSYSPKNFYEQFAFYNGDAYVNINNSWVKLESNAEISTTLTKQTDNCGRSNVNITQGGGFTYGTTVETVGSTVINGYYGVSSDPRTDFRDNDYGQLIAMTTRNNETAQCRLLYPVDLAGKSIYGFLYEQIAFSRTFTPGTATATFTLKKMNASGNLTTIATATHLYPATSDYYTSLSATGTPVSFTTGDRLVMELQLAPTTPTHDLSKYCYFVLFNTAANAILNVY
jgi:hypothetical protein